MHLPYQGGEGGVLPFWVLFGTCIHQIRIILVVWWSISLRIEVDWRTLNYSSVNAYMEFTSSHQANFFLNPPTGLVMLDFESMFHTVIKLTAWGRAYKIRVSLALSTLLCLQWLIHFQLCSKCIIINLMKIMARKGNEQTWNVVLHWSSPTSILSWNTMLQKLKYYHPRTFCSMTTSFYAKL